MDDLAALYDRGETGTQEALELARVMFNEAYSRPGANKVLVLVTDGRPTPHLNPNLPGKAEELKLLENIKIITVAITENPGDSLLDIVSQPVEENYFNITTFADLPEFSSSVGKALQVCPTCPAPKGINLSLL